MKKVEGYVFAFVLINCEPVFWLNYYNREFKGWMYCIHFERPMVSSAFDSCRISLN